MISESTQSEICDGIEQETSFKTERGESITVYDADSDAVIGIVEESDFLHPYRLKDGGNGYLGFSQADVSTVDDVVEKFVDADA